MTPEEAVAFLADLLKLQGAMSDDRMYMLMAKAGMTRDEADHVHKFAQIAWGRAFLSGMGIEFSPDYMWLDVDGRVVETGVLTSEPYFAAATQLASRYLPCPGVTDLALRSADVASVNAALKRGSKPESLLGATPLLFRAPPTAAGLAAADRLSIEDLRRRARHKVDERGDS